MWLRRLLCGRFMRREQRDLPTKADAARVLAGRSPCRLLCALLLGAVVLSSPALVAAAQPYTPAQDDEVLEQLPATFTAGRDELTTLRRRLAADPKNDALALETATRFVQLGDSESDWRFYGYARAAIQPWWDSADPPRDILRLRAKLKEKDHGYQPAAADLTLLLQSEPRNVQAWVTLSNIYRVLGDYDKAWQASEQMAQFAGPIPLAICRVPLQAASGKAQQAYAELAQILPQVRDRSPSTVQWILTMQGEIALALGKDQEAEEHFREGLKNKPGDKYLLRSYADFLLDRGRHKEVAPLLREYVNDNGIMLCAAIAARRSGDLPQAQQWQAELAERFAEMRLRGSSTQGRYEARYALQLKDDPREAVTLASANWKLQKEMHDARVLLEAAIAAHDGAAGRPVAVFLQEHGTENVLLLKLVEQLDRK